MPHSNHSPSPTPATFPELPPFSDGVPTAPLLRISLEKLLSRDSEEEERCWKACCELGFFYLDLRTSAPSKDGVDGQGLLQHADGLFEVMKGFFDLEVEEKIKYDFAGQGSYFGYKGFGVGIVDKDGTRDKNEFYNISKDDILALTPPLSSPPILNLHRALYASYIHASHKICMLVTSLLSTRLSLKEDIQNAGGLPSLHKLTSQSGDQIRFVKAPPQTQTLKGVALGEHTDFGSVTVLFNRLGGLQVRLPPTIHPVPPSSQSNGSDAASRAEQQLCQDGWTYVRPLPGHCIINLGDALSKFSNGALRSNIHRVVAPPGEQGSCTRYSLVYFCRPEDDVRLRRLVEGGKEGEHGVEEDEDDEEEVTAKDWILRRALGRRKVDGWQQSGGTEEASMRNRIQE